MVRMVDGSVALSSPTNSITKNIDAMKQTPRQMREAKKAYEKLVDHLIEENYASNKIDADTIISGMSEEWYHMIING